MFSIAWSVCMLHVHKKFGTQVIYYKISISAFGGGNLPVGSCPSLKWIIVWTGSAVNPTTGPLRARRLDVFDVKSKPNSITLSWSQTGPKHGRRPAVSWNLACHIACYMRWKVCDQDSVMEFGLHQLWTGLRPVSNCIEIARTWSQSGSKPNSIMLSWSQTGPKLVTDLQRAGIWPII